MSRITEGQLIVACERIYAATRQWPVRLRLHPADREALPLNDPEVRRRFAPARRGVWLYLDGRVLQIVEDVTVPLGSAYLEVEAKL